MNWETLLCLGDSITIGARSYLGYPEYTGQLLSEATSATWNIVNYATCGFTAIDLHRSLTSDFWAIQAHRPAAATLLIGTNDLKGPTPLSDFAIAYHQLLLKMRLLLGNGAPIFLITIPPLLPLVKYPYRVDMNTQVAQYNNLIAEVGATMGCEVLTVTLQSAHFFDGVHLNTVGAKAFAKQLATRILAHKGSLQV